MDEATNTKIKEHEIQTNEWEFSELAKELYGWFDRFNNRFFENKLKTPVISFERRGVRNLGHFVLNRNALGLKWNININRQYLSLPLLDTLATLLHELLHQWQQEFGKKKQKRSYNNYHNVEFREKARAVGLPSNERGIGLGYYEPFLSFLSEHGVDINRKIIVNEEKILEGAKGSSKLKKWSCVMVNKKRTQN